MTKLLIATLILGLSQTAGANEPPAATRDAERVSALADGSWLSLGKSQLVLRAADGGERTAVAVRSKQLDSRPLAIGALVATFDADSQLPLLLAVDTKHGSIAPAYTLPAPDFSVDAVCLYRDDHLFDHLFLLGKDGLGEQWLLSGPQPRLLRRLATPPQPGSCRVDDASHTLYVGEEDFGIWAYDADGEGVPQRHPVVAHHPWGSLTRDPADFAALPGGIAMIADDRRTVDIIGSAGKVVQRLAVVGAERLAADSGHLLVRVHGVWRYLAVKPLQTPAARPVAVHAQVETDPVARRGDAADDPAIWIDHTDPSRSLILGTNKKQGLLSYDLQGHQRQLLEAGRLNNVDVRQQVRFGARQVDLAVATQRDEKALALFAIATDGSIHDVGRIATELDDIYGTCLYQPPQGGLEVFANDKDGRYVQYRVQPQGDGYVGKVVRRFRVASQPEGCVVDDRAGRLFFGEEDRGIWSVPAAADAPTKAQLILPVGPLITADVEGLALYRTPHATYLLASSQGDSSYVVLDAVPPYTYRGRFRIGINAQAGIDGVSDTDGIETTAVNLGGSFGDGMLIVQDGYKRLPDGAQNFKYVAWRDIAAALGLR